MTENICHIIAISRILVTLCKMGGASALNLSKPILLQSDKEMSHCETYFCHIVAEKFHNVPLIRLLLQSDKEMS